MRQKKIFLDESIPLNEKHVLTKIIMTHEAIIVSSPAEATHIVKWDLNVDGILPSELYEEYIRTLEIRRPFGSQQKPDASPTEDSVGLALVHWWYHPDSYDEWIPASDVDINEVPDVAIENLGVDTVNSLVWEVSCRFIRDVEIFNEWGNEIDYEIDLEKDDVLPEVPLFNSPLLAPKFDANAPKTRGRKSKKSKYIGEDAKTSVSSRKKNVEPAFGTVLEASIATVKAMNDVPPPSCAPARVIPEVVKRDLEYSVIDIEPAALDVGANPAQSASFRLSVETPGAVWGGKTSVKETSDEQHNGGLLEPDHKRRKIGGNKSFLSSEQSAKLYKSPGLIGFKLSTLPGWFRTSSVSSIEIRYLSEFFDGSSPLKTPDNYLSMRSFICNLYSQNTTIYLSATDCRKKLAGDAGSIIRVHHFLDTFGIINHAVAPEARPPILPMSLLHPLQKPSVFASHRGETCNAGSKSAALIGTRYKQIQWDAATDNELVKSVLKHGLDWHAVGIDMGSIFCGMGITAEDCVVRFAELPLTNTQITNNLGHNDKEEQVQMEIIPESGSTVVESGLEEGGKGNNISMSGHIQKLLNEYIHARMNVLEEKVLISYNNIATFINMLLNFQPFV